MNKTEFLLALTEGLSALPWDEVDERRTFYNEMIDDRMEEGLSEEEAVAAMGDINGIISQIMSEVPLSQLVRYRMKTARKPDPWNAALLILGSPVWVPLLVAAFAVGLSLYLVLWSVIISFWAVFASFAGCALGGFFGGIILAVTGKSLPGIALIAAALVFAGLAIFLFIGCKAAAKGTALLTKKLGLGIKRLFIKKEAVQCAGKQ